MEKNTELKSQIESMLFVAAKPVNIKDLASALAMNVSTVSGVLNEIIEEYKDRGLRITKQGDNYQMVSAPENSKSVARFLNEELRGDLSKASLEVLAIIFYKQPLTRIDVEAIRGVNSQEVLRQLMLRGLVCEVGRKEAIGRPILYGTTMEFLKHLGLEDEQALPKIEELLEPSTVPE